LAALHGAGIGLAIRGGAFWTALKSLHVDCKSSHMLKVGDVILILNVLIFSAAAFFWHRVGARVGSNLGAEGACSHEIS